MNRVRAGVRIVGVANAFLTGEPLVENYAERMSSSSSNIDIAEFIHSFAVLARLVGRCLNGSFWIGVGA